MTTVFVIRSLVVREHLQVIQGVYRKFEKVNGHVVQSELPPEIRDKSGRAFRRTGNEFGPFLLANDSNLSRKLRVSAKSAPD